MKEFYRSNLPHFQQPGQIYFVTWNLKDAIPSKLFTEYSNKSSELKSQIEYAIKSNASISELELLKHNYQLNRKNMMNAYENKLHRNENSDIDLSQKEVIKILYESVCYWNDKKISNIALCIMPNHIHWVFRLMNSEDKENWLQEILRSVKTFTARNINLYLGRSGSLWQRESWDTTIRNDKHLFAVIEYVIKNPVKAGLVKDWKEWNGTFIFE
jgi:putative transposase